MPTSNMPVFANTKYKPDDWYFETSATIGQQCPVRSLKLADTLNCGIALAGSIMHAANPMYAWVNFKRWVSNSEYGSEIISKPSIQVFATRHGFALAFNWDYLLIPKGVRRSDPVLIYDYDAFCFIFCDKRHFWPKSKVTRFARRLFKVDHDRDKPPSIEGARWLPVRDYMSQFELHADESGHPVQPDYAN